MNSTQPSGAVAGSPTAAATAAGGVMTVSSVTTVAGTILIFMAIAAVLIYLQFYFDAWSRRDQSRHGSHASRRRHGGGAAGGIWAGARGVDPDVLRSLPVTVYRAAAGSKAEEEECAVCLAVLEDGEAARFLPRCGHGFHAECVDTWLASHTTCPLCRLTVVAKLPDASPAPSLALRPLPPEPANLPASVLLGVSDRGAVAMASDGDDCDTWASAGTTGLLVIEIPEVAAPTLLTPRDAAKSPGSARPRSFRRLWSFGRQGAESSSSCSCGGASEGADVEQGVSVAIGLVLAEAQLASSEAAAGAIQVSV